MALRLITPPATPVVTLEEAKGHLVVLHDDDNTLITAMIAAATGMFDGSPGELNRALISQGWDFELEEGFACGRRMDLSIPLPLAPVISVDSIKYVDLSGSEQTLPPSEWRAQTGERPCVHPAPGTAWPVTLEGRGAATITFTAGYGENAEAVPAAIKAAILLTVGDLYANRESSVQGTISSDIKMVPVVDRLVSPYRHWPA